MVCFCLGESNLQIFHTDPLKDPTWVLQLLNKYLEDIEEPTTSLYIIFVVCYRFHTETLYTTSYILYIFTFFHISPVIVYFSPLYTENGRIYTSND